jgi:crossover junction endodeoxyribonuclease RuvC
MPETNADKWGLFRRICMESSGGIFAFIEFVSASPQMGVTSSFTFGQGYGHLEMALTGWEVPFERVRPAVWMKEMQCMTKGDKSVSKRKAQELFPTLKITNWSADALLIAEYGVRTIAKRQIAAAT